MILSRSITYLIFFFLLLKPLNIYAEDQVCEFNFDVKNLTDIYDKYNGKEVKENGNNNDCINLESLNSIKSFWMLKLKALCTETTSILDKNVLKNICSRKFNVPHVKINGIKVGNDVVNLEFVCAHFLYNNNKEIIKCVKNNIMNNYLDYFHVAFDLSVSQELLKQSDNVDFVLNLRDIDGLGLVKKIIDDSLCRIHSGIHSIMSEDDFYLFKALVGLCTKLGFHTHFVITDNIHPLVNPLYYKMPYSLNSLNFSLENSSLYYANYEYFLYNIKLSEAEYTLNTYISPSVLRINQNNSYITWVGLKKDNNIYNKKFKELYNLLDKIKYIERIIFCYSKYTSRYYQNSINHLLKYLPENKRDIMENNSNIFFYIINQLCGNIPSIHKCVEKIISLDGVYDIFFKNFMINFIYFNASCIFNCSSVDLEKLFNDERLWNLLLKYFSHSYLVKYKKKTDVPENSDEYSKLSKTYYTNFDYDYIHSGKWRKEINLDDEDAILKPSDDAVEYEFYNYTYQTIDLGNYSLFILRSKMDEDNICKIASFIEPNGKKYVHSNQYIENFFNKNNKRMLSHDDGKNHTNNSDNVPHSNDGISNNSNSDDDTSEEDEDKDESHLDSFNLFDDFLGNFKGGNILDILKNNNFTNRSKLFGYNDDGGDDEEEDEHLHSDTDEEFDIEKFKVDTNNGSIYPLKRSYDAKELQEIYEIHPDFNDSDEELRNKFFNDELFGKNIFFSVKNIPTKIPKFYKYYYEIKKKYNIFNEQDKLHYSMLTSNYESDPDIFSKMDINFACSKNGTWPIRKVSGRWISNVLCEAHLVPQLVYNNKYAESKKKVEDNNDSSNEIDAELYTLKEATRLIGIEFEEHEPHRCAISYLGNEVKKNLLPVSASILIQIAVGYCVLHGFKTIWISDSAFDIHTNIYLRYTSILEKGLTYYEQSKFELFGQTRLVPKLEYIASGLNIKNNIITSSVFKTRYSIISFPGVDLKFQLLMSKKIKSLVYNLSFDCNSIVYKGCSEYYPLMKNIKNMLKNDTIILNGTYTDKEKDEMYQCFFMHDKTFIELNKMFPKECTFGSRIGDCHRKVRKNIACYDEQSCKYHIYLYENFLKPQNHLNLLYEHFVNVSEKLTKLAKPNYLQSIVSLEHDIQVKKSNKENTEYDEILLFILKNSVYYVSWATSSEYWKRAIYVQNTDSINNSYDNNNEYFCPVAYAHEYIRQMLVQYMKFPNI